MNERLLVATAPRSVGRTVSSSPHVGTRPHFLHVFPTFGHGGVPIRIAAIANYFGARYRHTIVALNGCYGAADRVDPGLDVRYADGGFARADLLKTALLSRALIRDARPDLLLTYNWGAIEWAAGQLLAPQCPHVHLESGFGPEEAARQISRRATFRRIALARAARVVVPSHRLVDIARDSWRIPAGRVAHIPNGVDCDAFGEPPRPDALAGFVKRPGELIVGTVSPLRPEKNIGRLLRAFAMVPAEANARLLILGDGEERSRLVALGQELGIAERTIFAGHVDRVQDVIGLIDVFALSSDTEQMPNAMLQAMAAGRAIAAVDVGDVKRLLPEESTAYVVATTGHVRLADAIGRLLRDDAARTRLGGLNQRHVRANYAMQRMFDAYRDLFDAVVPVPAARASSVGTP